MALLWLAGLALIALAAGCSRAAERAARSEPGIALAPCQLGRPDMSVRLAAKCGSLTVPENRNAPGGRQITLHIAVVPAISRDPASDPIFYLAGGPGSAATEDYLALAGAFSRLNEKRDIVLVDQRGTGQSHPLACPAADAAAAAAANAAIDVAVSGTVIGDGALSTAEGDEAYATWAQDCLSELDADTRYYTTSDAIQDLDQVREALGYPQVNLYGVSYGTRVALSYLRRYPTRTRTVILDGVVPQDEALGLTMSSDAQRALNLIFLRCAADTACREAYSDLGTRFTRLLARLDQAPVRLTIADPTTGEPVEVTFDREQLGLAVRLFSYQTETAALLPMLIYDAAATGDLSRLAAQYLIVSKQLEGNLNRAMHNSVVCAEDVPFYGESGGSANGAVAERDGYLGMAYQDLESACSAWSAVRAPADFKQPVTSDVPALLLSGEADPVTPPANAERVAATLKNSVSAVAPGQGHGVILRGCAWRVATDFVESGTVDGLEIACIGQTQPFPFFTNNTGPH